MKAHGMYIVLDVETKNLGSDIMRDNEQLLSLQLGDATKQKLYYYDSKNPKLTLEIGKKQITILLSQGVVFAGYNIKGFVFFGDIKNIQVFPHSTPNPIN